MQEEVTRKTIALAIKAAKLDGKMLQAALRKLLQLYRKARDTPHHGKQTLKQLMRHGTGVSNIEITDANIKAFESTAQKYGIDFALKKAEIEAKKAAIRAEDIAKGVFVPVSSLPQREPMKGVQTA